MRSVVTRARASGLARALVRAAVSSAAIGFAALALASTTPGCESEPDTPSCGTLPDETACPLSEGGSCGDPSCSAIYACRGGAWSLVSRCDVYVDGGGAGADAAIDGGDAGDGCGSVMLPPTTADCPPLEAPECDATLVDQCPASACSTGCTDFLRCTPPNGWSVEVAYCDDDGMLIMSKK